MPTRCSKVVVVGVRAQDEALVLLWNQPLRTTNLEHRQAELDVRQRRELSLVDSDPGADARRPLLLAPVTSVDSGDLRGKPCRRFWWQ
jgi:hypothetical protein